MVENLPSFKEQDDGLAGNQKKEYYDVFRPGFTLNMAIIGLGSAGVLKASLSDLNMEHQNALRSGSD